MDAFTGKRVFITGGSSGIGRQLAVDLLKRGAHVSIAAEGADRLEEARRELLAIAPRVDAFRCDIAELAQIRRTAAAYVERFGAPDVLVNNAGYAVYRTIEEMESEEIDRLLRVNLNGACLVTREFLPSMIAAGRGDVVLIASIAGRVTLTPCGPYSTAKHGLVAFGEILRAELDRFHVHVQVVCPGRVETGFFGHESFRERADRRETEWTVPIERVSEAVLEAVARNRFLTYVPASYGPLVWLTEAVPFIFKPMIRRLMRARVASVHASKQPRQE